MATGWPGSQRPVPSDENRAPVGRDKGSRTTKNKRRYRGAPDRLRRIRAFQPPSSRARSSLFLLLPNVFRDQGKVYQYTWPGRYPFAAAMSAEPRLWHVIGLGRRVCGKRGNVTRVSEDIMGSNDWRPILEGEKPSLGMLPVTSTYLRFPIRFNRKILADRRIKYLQRCLDFSTVLISSWINRSVCSKKNFLREMDRNAIEAKRVFVNWTGNKGNS